MMTESSAENATQGTDDNGTNNGGTGGGCTENDSVDSLTQKKFQLNTKLYLINTL